MDPDAEVTFEFAPVIRQYKSGRVERLLPVNPVPPSVDAATGVASKDVTLDPATGLWARLYLPVSARHPGGDSDRRRRRLPIVLYFHGGGLVVGSAADAPEHAFMNRLAARAGALAVSVEYRLAPEHPVPACYDDAWAALRLVVTPAPAADPWVRDHGDLVCLADDALVAEGKAYYEALLASGWDAADAELLDSAPADHEFHLREPDSDKAVLLMDRLVARITGSQSSRSSRPVVEPHSRASPVTGPGARAYVCLCAECCTGID